MTEVFISYRREDEVRVVQLVQALERAGLSVWWDRGLAGGENWHAVIGRALDAAKCVIVIWTSASVESSGGFVRDEARRAAARGILVPVRMEKVDPPLGFGEIQAIDLTHWKGNRRDPFLQDLVAAVRAKLEGRPVPPARGPMKRLIRRATYSGLLTALTSCGLAFGLNAFHTQQALCNVPVFQPGISDACGALGLGGLPARHERLVWTSRTPGNCDDLRSYLTTFPNGAYRNEAMAMLAAQKAAHTDIWIPTTRPLRLYVPQEGESANEDSAKAAALVRAQKHAERQCRDFGAGTLFRYKSAKIVAEEWDCHASGQGVTCGFDGKALCELEERESEERITCGDQ